MINTLEKEGVQALMAQHPDRLKINAVKKLRLKYHGTDVWLDVLFGDEQQVRRRFEKSYQQQFGFVMAQQAIVVDSIFVEVVGLVDALDWEAVTLWAPKVESARHQPRPTEQVSLYVNDQCVHAQ